MGQTVDEAHYVLYGKYLALSYFDHPPLVGWVHFIFQSLPVGSILASRLPSILISLLTSYLIYKYLIEKNVSEKNAIYSVGVLNLTPLFNTMSIALLPDTLLMPLTVWILDRTEKLMTHSNLKNWLLLGLFLGLAGLSKYTAIVYIIALIIIFILKNKISELKKPALWAGALLALTIVSPVLIWNLKNDFISFKYQGNHVSSFDSNALKTFFSSFAVQIVSWGVGPFIVAIWVHATFIKRFRDLRSRFISFIFLSVFLLFFVYVALSEVLLPHWMLIYFILMIPIAYSQWLEKDLHPRITKASIAISALLTFALLFESAFKVFPIRNTAALYEGITGWDSLISEANEKLAAIESPQKGLAVMNWTLGSRAMYYNTIDSKIFVLDKRFDQFDIWNAQSPMGFELIILVEAAKKEEHLNRLNCSNLMPLGEKITTIKEVPVNHFLYYHCSKFVELKD
jgi:4-amino-4-deoxy-L-arabinose transferase-like glycosyltransferase